MLFKRPNHLNWDFAGGKKPTIPVEIRPEIKGKFDHVWSFTSSQYDKAHISGLQFDDAYTSASFGYIKNDGGVVQVSGTNRAMVLDTTLTSKTKATVVIRFKPNVINNNNSLFATDFQNYANTLTVWMDNLGSNTSNVNCVSVHFGGGTTGARLETAANSIAVGEFSTLVVSYDGTNGNQIVSVDGQVKTTLDAGSLPSSLSSLIDRISLNEDIGLARGDADVAFLAVSGQYAATEAECREWSKNLYTNFFRSAANAPIMLGVVGGAGGVSVTPIADTLTISSGTLSITAENEARVTPTADALSISAGTLTVTQGTNTFVTPIADTLTITQGSLSITAESETRVNLSADALTVTEGQLTVTQSGPVDITPIADAITISAGNLSVRQAIEETTFTGGWYDYWQPTKEQIRKQREELGIIKPEINQITRVIKKISKGQIKPEQARAEVKEYFQSEGLDFKPKHDEAVSNLVRFLQQNISFNPIEYAAQKAQIDAQRAIEEREYQELVALLKAQQQAQEEQDMIFVLMCLAA